MKISDKIINIVTNCKSMVVITGAGISAESGIPTFRGSEGLWSSYRPEDLATPEAFAANPDLVWKWYRYRRGIIREAAPNAGHKALSQIEDLLETFMLVTQNVDGLHRKAGSRNFLEVHGNIWLNRCTVCDVESWMEDAPPDEGVPYCACGGILRPGVVWFGEALPNGVFESAVAAVRTCNILMVVGTSSVVYPVASLPSLAISLRIPVIEINNAETPLTPNADFHLRGSATTWLPIIADAIRVSCENKTKGGRSNV